MSQIYLDGKNIQYLSTYLKQKLLLHTKLFTKKIFLNLVLINILKINRFPFLFSKSACKKGFQFFREQQKNIGIYLSSCTNKTSCSQIKRSSQELDFYRYIHLSAHKIWGNQLLILTLSALLQFYLGNNYCNNLLTWNKT